MAFGRRRAVLGWTAISLAAGGVVIAAVSTRWSFGVLKNDWFVGVERGVLAMGEQSLRTSDEVWMSRRVGENEPIAWLAVPSSESAVLNWWFVAYDRIDGFGINARWVSVVWWAPTVVAGVSGALLVRSGRQSRILPGRCICGYDRRGIAAAAPCPECGHPSGGG